MAVAPAVDVVSRYTSERFGNSLKKHLSVQSKIFGDNFLMYVHEAANGYVRADGKKISGVTEKVYKKHADNISVLHDKGQKYLQSKKTLSEIGGELSKKHRKALESDIAFFERAVNVKEWMKTLDKEQKYGDGLNKASKEGVLKYANFNTDDWLASAGQKIH